MDTNPVESKNNDREILTEAEVKTTIDTIYLGVEKIENLEKDLIVRKEEIENAKTEVHTMEEEFEMITEIKSKTENMIAIFQRVYDRGSVLQSESDEIERLTKKLKELEKIMNERYSYMNDLYNKIDSVGKTMKTTTDELMKTFDRYLSTEKNDDVPDPDG